MYIQIQQQVEKLKQQLQNGNAFHERVQIVAATKMQTPEAINAAIAAGVDAVAENKPQEFRDKDAFVAPCPRHFIGHLQTNKVKYLVGKVELFHSCDRDELALEIGKQSIKKGVVSNVLVQINVGMEDTKGGYDMQEAKQVFARLSQMEGICVKEFSK